MFRRRRAAALLLVLIVVLSILLVPRIVTASVAAGVRADLDALVDVSEGALAASSSLVPAVAAEALTEARDAVLAGDGSDDANAAGVATLSGALATYRTAATDAVRSVLGEWSDAERSTEDALFAEIATIEDAERDQLVAALTAASAAAETVRASARSYRQDLATTSTSAQPTGGDVDAQLSYLLAHAETGTYNSQEWGDYNEAGGDCVNFTSQGLLQRGWVMDDSWYSGGPWKASQAWRDTGFIDQYLTAQGFAAHTIDDLDRVRVGDVGVFDWGDTGPGLDHTMTVSRVEYSVDGPVISFASHNTDGSYRPMPATLSDPGSGSKMRIYSIP